MCLLLPTRNTQIHCKSCGGCLTMISLFPIVVAIFSFSPSKVHSFHQTAASPLRSKPTSRILTALATAAPKGSQLEQLSRMTVLSIDSGDLNIIRKYAETGYITDATTNPLFVAQAGMRANENPDYARMVEQAVAYAVQQEASASTTNDIIVATAMDRLAVNLGTAIAEIVPGYISTEVDPRLSFDTTASIERALRMIAMYEAQGIQRNRVLMKLAATWEGIQAAHTLETEHGIQCNLTLIFSVTQALACAQYGAHLISPFPGRILDWHKTTLGRPTVDDLELDEGVIACKQMQSDFIIQGYDTICMPASWRPSRGSGYDLDEIRALAGVDRMTIPPPLLDQLKASTELLERKILSTNRVVGSPTMERMSEKEFRYRMCMDGCGNDKLAEGLRSFCQLTEELETVIQAKVNEYSGATA